ncbi:MAG: hypothetical protein QF735_13260, partial [Phycisphaeraceae bacterium]|nr:hypothetical protein [Phycisphaeraceae bacterium]
IRLMAQNGKKVVLREGIGRMHKNPDVDAMEQRLVNMLDEVKPDWLYASTLGEEQVYWHGLVGCADRTVSPLQEALARPAGVSMVVADGSAQRSFPRRLGGVACRRLGDRPLWHAARSV